MILLFPGMASPNLPNFNSYISSNPDPIAVAASSTAGTGNLMYDASAAAAGNPNQSGGLPNLSLSKGEYGKKNSSGKITAHLLSLIQLPVATMCTMCCMQ